MTGVADLLREMVAIDSVNGVVSGRPNAEGELVDFLAAQASAYGLPSRRYAVPNEADNLLIHYERSGGAPWLLFENHMDTVGGTGLSTGPDAERPATQFVHGRGACDAKGSGAAMLSALGAHAAGSEGGSNVALLFTVDEETSKSGIQAFVETHLPSLNWRPIGAVVGEPTGLRMVVAHNGVVRLAIRTEGIAAHASDPGRGLSAIRKMATVMAAVEDRYIAGLTTNHPLTPPAVCSINMISGGSEVNIIPDRCEIRIDRRTVPGEDGGQVIADLEDILVRLRRRDPELIVSIRDTYVDPPLRPVPEAFFATRIASLLRDLDLPDEPTGTGFGTDASTLSDAGIPAVVLGPGDIAQAHTRHEWLALDELERAEAIYTAIMRSDRFLSDGRTPNG